MRVLHVIESLAAGGIETTFLNMLRAWRQEPAWAEQHVLAFAGGPLDAAYREAADALTITASQDELERAVLEPYDVIYFLFERCAFRLLPFAAAHSRAAIVYGKGYDMGGMFRLNDGLAWQPDESMMWGSDRATFTTQDLAAGFDLPASRCQTLGKAAAIAPFLALPEVSPVAAPRIVCVANLHARKRPGDLITAASRLRLTVPEIRVRFVGADDGREGERLRAQARDLEMEDAVELVGRRSDVTADLLASQVFALPSGCEGVPTAMLEAMAAARPVVMTNVGHISSVIKDGAEGFIVPVGDITAMTKRLKTLMTDRPLAMKMGRAARDRVHTHDVRAVAARLRAALEQTVARVAHGMAA
jgi:glycosyltransferase involved in cell wall biosynthesis